MSNCERTMVQPSPGSLVEYQASGSALPPWPAVVCTDNMAPKEVQRTRPQGLRWVSKINLRSHWAHAGELADYDPFTPFTNEEVVGGTPRLGGAYEMANNTLEAGITLEYWQEQVVHQKRTVSGSDSKSDPYSQWNENDEDDGEDEGKDNGDSDEDFDFQLALRASQEDYDRQHSERERESPPLKRPRHTKSRVTVTRPSRISKDYKDASTSRLRTQPRPSPKGASSSSSPAKSLPPRRRDTLRRHDTLRRCDTPRRPIDDSSVPHQPNTTRPDEAATSSNTMNSTPFQHKSFLDRTLGGLRSCQEPTSDIVEGELSNSEGFVQIPVGPTGEVSTLPKGCVWNRQYWQDIRYGVNHFDLNDAGIWELRHPALPSIAPGDFAFAAEYLESDDFGHRDPRGGDSNIKEEAFVQCIAAWGVAEKLRMTDLMDHIVDKLERCIEEPELQVVTIFARQIYEAEDLGLPSQARLKDWLATYIAQNWWIYLGDDHLSGVFLETLMRLPELERDIYVRRLVALNERLDGDEEGDEDGELDG
ncbi:hypothetical protein GMOD_00006646 [Pyrenophora seminiperda CCB06]|uniref:Uncharacterized protein n=1 Tax=Pyrenophora seminiperda CCB06 TaxID=1302712 RepID=A0A3M7MAG3_9PLEO|nr:hypothetical protein GMOD_00006646 [Pyrenophora seminiperda CCB06]